MGFQYTAYYVISMILNVPLSLSATEQSIWILSPVSKITLEPDKTSNELPVGIGAFLIILILTIHLVKIY